MPPLSSKDQSAGWAAYALHIPKEVALGSSSWDVCMGVPQAMKDPLILRWGWRFWSAMRLALKGEEPQKLKP